MNAPPPVTSPSVLQRSFGLAELLDLNAFREVCDSYAELFQIGFKLFDRSREMLIDAKGGAVDFCAYAFTIPEGKSRCIQEVSTIRDMRLPPNGPVFHDCFTGLRYLIAPILHEGDEVGRIVYGPYLPVSTAPRPLPNLGPKFKPEIAERLLSRVRRVADDVVAKVVRHIVGVVEVMLFTGYKQLLTSRMHVEAVTASYNELQNRTQQLRESYERLKDLDRLKSNFLATVSHELRTPLTSVIGYSEMLLEGLAGSITTEQREYVQTIMDKGENLLQLISSILDFSKVESGGLRLALAEDSLTEVARTALSTVVPLARKQAVQLQAELPKDDLKLRMDATKIRQALVNVLGNAVKFNRSGGWVRLEAQRVQLPARGTGSDSIPPALAPPDEEFARVVVSDGGIGIPTEQMNRIFDSFYQVDNSSTREYGGTGLGLAITRSFIEAHGGSIDVTSELGKGSTFTILLPLRPVA